MKNTAFIVLVIALCVILAGCAPSSEKPVSEDIRSEVVKGEEDDAVQTAAAIQAFIDAH